jgi:spore germination protein KB
MRTQTSGTVGIREYVAMVLLVIGVKLSDKTPALYFDSMKSAAWMGPILAGIITVIPLFFLIKVLSLYKNKNLHDVNCHLFGKYIGMFISFLFFIYGSAVILADARSYVDIISTVYYPKTPTLVIFIALMAACSYTAKKGIQHIGSLSWMTLFYIKFTLAFALLLTLQDGHLFAIFPFLGPGIKEIVKESVLKTSLFGEFLYLALIFPYLASAKVFSKGSWIALVFLTIEISIAFLLYIMMFDYMPASHLSYPFHEVIKYISIGRFITSLDTLFFPFWIIATLIRFSVFFFLDAVLLGSIFKIKHFEYAIPILASVFLIIGMIPETPSFTIYKLMDPFYQLMSPFFITFPILLWVIAKLRGDFKSAHYQNNS